MTNYSPRVVIFDLDKTLTFSNVSFLFGRTLYKKGRLSFFSMLFLVSSYLLQTCGFLSVQRLHELAFKKIFLGKCQKRVEEEVELFLKEVQNLFREPLIALVVEAKEKGACVWLQSSSPECLVAPIAKLLGIDRYTATEYATDDKGNFASVARVVDGKRKQVELMAYLEEQNMVTDDVVAYSDSMLDLPLLECVGSPIAVCPDSRLARIAQKRSWKVLDV